MLERQRKVMAMTLRKTNAELLARTEELKKHEGRLRELVEERTAELTAANRSLEREISERKETESFLKASENRFRTLVEHLPLSIFLKDGASAYLYCNKNCARELEIKPQDILGKTDYDFYPEEVAVRHIEEDRRILASLTAEEREERYQRNGQEVIIQRIVLPIKYEDDSTGILGIAWDVTEKIRLEAIAEAANTMSNIGYVFAGISHEIGSPLSAMKLTLRLLESKLDTGPIETVKAYIERIKTEATKVEYLLKSLKNFNMYETPELQDLPLQPFLERFLALVTGDFEKKGIRVRGSMRPEALCGRADPRALQQVLLNIMSNAADALEGKENPEIAVSVQKTDGFIRIRVTDNGCGISERQCKELFKPFRTTKAGGTGLGLVIARRMLTGMRGAIEIKSRQGEGTTVDISLPGGQI